MLCIYVKHYLTPMGLEFYQKFWLPSVYEKVGNKAGFVSLHSDIQGDCAFIDLRFTDKALFDVWCLVIHSMPLL